MSDKNRFDLLVELKSRTYLKTILQKQSSLLITALIGNRVRQSVVLDGSLVRQYTCRPNQ